MAGSSSSSSSGSAWLEVIGTGLSLMAQEQERDAKSDLARRQARVARENARIVREQGEEDARRFRIFADKKLGTARAAVGASGVRMAGSALDSLEETARNLETDALSIEYEAEVRAMNLEAQGKDFDLRRKDIREAAPLETASTILSGYSRYRSRQPVE